MYCYRRLIGCFAAATLVVTIGCLNRGTNGGNGNGNTGGTVVTRELAAVQAVTDQLQAVSKALASFVDGLALVDMTSNSTPGDCPIVTASTQNGIRTVSVEYPQGCTNPYYGATVPTGGLSLSYDSATKTLTVTFDNFTLDGQSVTGSFSLQVTDVGFHRSYVGTIDVTTGGVGSATGDLTVEFDFRNDMITIASGALTLTDASGTAYDVQVSGVVFEPVANGNFVPDAGTVTFEMPNTGPGPATLTIVVTFDAQSPVDGTVHVKVGDAPPVDYQLPGVG